MEIPTESQNLKRLKSRNDVSRFQNNNKAEYGKKVVEELAQKLTLNYGKNFARAALFRMIQFYRKFPDNQIVATLSQQLTWSAKEENLCCLNVLPYPKSLKKQ